MFDRFDMIRVINLPSRLDRRSQVENELSKVGLKDDPRVAFFEAVRPETKGAFSSIGAYGCYLSHLAIIEEAVSRESSVLILEDDCVFAPHAKDHVLSEPFDIFYGGYWAASPQCLSTSDLVGAHMMGFSSNGAKSILKYLTSLKVAQDHPPIDAAYIWFRRAHPDILTNFAVPPVGYQRPSRSDIEPGRFYNRIVVLRSLVEIARRLRFRFQDVSALTGKIK